MTTRRRKFTLAERAFVVHRAHGCCEYCHAPLDFSTETFEIEHIVPLFKGGTNEMDNLALSCGGCNGRTREKVSAVDPLSDALVNLYNPRTEKWHAHFAWLNDFSLVGGITPTGRATVEQLQLNRPAMVNLRVALRTYGVHPPDYGSW